MLRLAACTLALVALDASATEPTFVIVLEESASGAGIWSKTRIEARYAPPPIVTGGAVGTRSPAQVLESSGGMGGLPVGATLPFYAYQLSGSGNASDGAAASMVPSGDGATLTTVSDKNGVNSYPQVGTPRGEGTRTRFKRTASGGELTFVQPMIETGGANYLAFFHLGVAELTREQVSAFFTFTFTDDERRTGARCARCTPSAPNATATRWWRRPR